MYCVTNGSQPPSWRRTLNCSECDLAIEYCSEAQPGEDWVWDASINAHRAPTDAELLLKAITIRIEALKAEVETYIDNGIYPITRSMLRDGVLADAVADDVREFIGMCYAEANQTIDAIEAVATIGEVDDPAPVWPIYGGAA